MKDEEYFKRVSKDFDLEEATKAAVWTAQWFVDMGLCIKAEALEALGVTEEQYDKYVKLPES